LFRKYRWKVVSKLGGLMLAWALIFLLVALIAGFFGFRGVEGIAMGIAKILFFIFIVLFIVSLIFGLADRARVSDNTPAVYTESTGS